MTINENRKAQVESLLLRVKKQNEIRGKISALLQECPKTVPEIADAAGMTTSVVLWHIVAMRKYGKVAEAELKGDYPSYRLIEVK